MFGGVGVECRGLGGACGECEGVLGGVYSSLKLYVAHFKSEPVGLGTCCNLCRSNEPLPNY